MDDEKLEKAVQEEYKKIYPKWKQPPRVTQTVPETFGGTLVVINAKDEDGEIVDEMCFVFDNDKVQIFSSTEQMGHFPRLTRETSLVPTSLRYLYPFWNCVLTFDRAHICSGDFSNDSSAHFDERVIAVLAAVVGSASGFYFGASRSRA
jgi:hypothetical protein